MTSLRDETDDDWSQQVDGLLSYLDKFTFASGQSIGLKQQQPLQDCSNRGTADDEPPNQPPHKPGNNDHDDSLIALWRQQAREERAEARAWASKMRQAVQTWMQHQKESTVTKLQHELQTSLQHYVKVEAQLHEIIQSQQERIEELERELLSQQQQPPQPRPRPAPIRTTTPTANDPDLITPRSTDTVEPKKPPVHPMTYQPKKKHTNNNSRVTHYRNGTIKETFPDGTVVLKFRNGDVQTIASHAQTYYFAASKVRQSIDTHSNVIVWEFPNGQVERHYPNGHKIVTFPDGTVAEETISS